MATAPVKSQPLHNFYLPFLKWGHKNQTNANHRYRRTSDAAPCDSASPPRAAEHRSSSSSEQELDRGDCSKSASKSARRKHAAGSRSEQRNRFGFASCSSQRQPEEVLEGKCDGVDGEGNDEKVAEAEESVAKPWKLRPRKGVGKGLFEIGGGSKIGESPEAAREIAASQQTENLPKSTRLRGFVEGHCTGKRKLWIALSREEIEEDVYSMTGSRASRRPKKRTKSLQKLIDNISPGFYLIGASADSYRTHDNL